MSEENTVRAAEGAGITSLARKSWTAYIGTFFLGVFVLLLVVPAVWTSSRTAGIVTLAIALAYLVYRVLTLRSYHLFYDNSGVWLERGVLPWNRGIVGVKWRDIDEAVFLQGLWSWLFKSYTLCVGHRFTKSSELLLSHMAEGDAAAMTVNAMHQDMLSAEALR